MAIKVAKVYCSIHNQGEVHCGDGGLQGDILLKRLFYEIGFKQDWYLVHSDSESVIYLSKNSSFHSRSKQIDMR